MTELFIDASGEMKLDYEVVGRITWASPVSHLYATGEWDQCGATQCWECGGGIMPEADYEELQDERDLLEERNANLTAQVARLRAQLAEVRGMLDIAP